MIINIIRALRFLRLALSCFGLCRFDVVKIGLSIEDLALRVLHRRSRPPGRKHRIFEKPARLHDRSFRSLGRKISSFLIILRLSEAIVPRLGLGLSKAVPL